jgi:hypothetical protein
MEGETGLKGNELVGSLIADLRSLIFWLPFRRRNPAGRARIEGIQRVFRSAWYPPEAWNALPCQATASIPA